MEPVEPLDDEPLFTVGDPESRIEVASKRRPGMFLGALVVVVAVFGLAAVLTPDDPPTVEPEPTPEVAPPEGGWPVVEDGWTWTPVEDAPAGDAAIWVGRGVAVVERPWAVDARWSFTADGSAWTEPESLAYNPIAATTGTVERPGATGVFAVETEGAWTLRQPAGIPPGIRIGWAAEHDGTIVAASTAPWARVDWSEVHGGPAGYAPTVRADGDQVVVSSAGGWGDPIGLTAVHDGSEVRLVDGDGVVRARVAGIARPPSDLDDPERWMLHGLVPQTLVIDAQDGSEPTVVAAPWQGEAAVTVDDRGFLAVSIDRMATGLEVWRSIDGSSWAPTDAVMVTTTPIQHVRAVGGGDAVVVEYCSSSSCGRLVLSDGLWWNTDRNSTFPTWSGGTWSMIEGRSIAMSPDAVTWESIPVPDFEDRGISSTRAFVLGGDVVLVSGLGPDGSLELVVGRPTSG